MAGAILAVAAAPALAQPPPVFEAEAALLEFEVRVTDRRGKPVTDLVKEDFEVFENGTLQSISTFEFVTQPVPLEETGSDRSPSQPPSGPESARDQLRRSTFIYIATRGRREDRTRIHDAVRAFLAQNLAPSVLVSIEGSPFTSKRVELDRTLEEMLRRGAGSRGGPSFTDTLAVDLARDIEYDAALEALIEEENDEFSDQLEEIADRSAFYRRLRMYEYIDLIRALSIFPGRKVVVLFSTGLPVDEDNLDIMKVLEDEATKARVRFYVSDVRGLGAAAPGGDAEDPGNLAALFGDLQASGFATSGQGRQDAQDGLYELARRTGGRAVLNSNDFGEVFDVLLRESGDYYLIGYYPRFAEQRGRLRRLRVSVRRPGLRVHHQRGYYEERPFRMMSRDERNLRMHQALMFDTPYLDLPLRVDHEFFRAADGAPTLVYSVGLHSKDIPSSRGKRGQTVKLTVIARASEVRAEGEPPSVAVIDERRFEMTMEEAALERLSADPSSWLHYGSQMSLAPGEYDWKVVLRDDVSGALGSYQTTLRIPELGARFGASSLLLTSRVDDVSRSVKRTRARQPKGEDVLLVDTSRFFASAVKSFRQGDPLFVLYDLYDPDAMSFESPPGATLALYRGRTLVERLPVTAHQTVPQPEASRIRHMVALSTENLDAGIYTIAALLPPNANERGVIYRRFEILDDAAARGADQ